MNLERLHNCFKRKLIIGRLCPSLHLLVGVRLPPTTEPPAPRPHGDLHPEVHAGHAASHHGLGGQERGDEQGAAVPRQRDLELVQQVHDVRLGGDRDSR